MWSTQGITEVQDGWGTQQKGAGSAEEAGKVGWPQMTEGLEGDGKTLRSQIVFLEISFCHPLWTGCGGGLGQTLGTAMGQGDSFPMRS